MSPRTVMRMVNERYPGSMMLASDPTLEIERIPCGILSIDMLLGGGFPRGRHVEIYGGYSVGKTYLSYRLIAEAQAAGYRCAFIDAERTFDPEFAAGAGVDLDSLAMTKRAGQNGNRLINIMEVYLRSEIYDVIVLDSIAALLPKQEEDSDMEEGNYGTAQAKLMSQALRRLTAANKRTVVVYINQTREAVGTMFGKRTITSGGRAMAFYAGTRLELVRTEVIKRHGKTIDIKSGKSKAADIVKGHRVLVRVEKDKTGGTNTGSETTFVFDYDSANADPTEDLIYLGRVYSLVSVSGTRWWVEGYEDEAQPSRSKFKRWLERNTAVAEELEELIRYAATVVDDIDPEPEEAEQTQ